MKIFSCMLFMLFRGAHTHTQTNRKHTLCIQQLMMPVQRWADLTPGGSRLTVVGCADVKKRMAAGGRKLPEDL